MKPDWESSDGAIRLFQGDCREVLANLEAGSIDAVVTDPPYGVGFNYGSGYKDAESTYAALAADIVGFERLLCTGGFMAVFQPGKHARRWSEWFPRQWQLFALPKTFTQGGRGDIVAAVDFVLWWRVGKGKPARSWQDLFARNWAICDTAPVHRDPLTRGHPCPRPLDGTTHIVRCVCPKGGAVLDPFLGSGTTAVACIRTGRRFVGVELNPEYFAIAVRRIKKEPAAGLFA